MPPDLSDRAYVSLSDDLKNHIHMVLQLSCNSQENGMLEIEHWKKVTLTLLIFRPFIEKVSKDKSPSQPLNLRRRKNKAVSSTNMH